MFKKFLQSYWFNLILAALAGFFAVMQEVWIGGIAVPIINVMVYVVLVAFGLSICAEMIKMVCYRSVFSWKKILIGGIAGTVVGLVTLLLV